MNQFRIALAGSPNCGKTALFNALTGGRQKVGNYSGVTVERKEGVFVTPSGLRVSVLDLPGTYSLDAKTPDERITRDVLLGLREDESSPEILVAVADATNLERNLSLVLELKSLDRRVILALNMMDLAKQRGLVLDLATLSRELGVPVVPTVAVRKDGIRELLAQLDCQLKEYAEKRMAPKRPSKVEWRPPTGSEIRERFNEVDRIIRVSTRKEIAPTIWTDRIDRIVVHPVWGTLILVGLLITIFQAVFTWASVPADWIEGAVTSIGAYLGELLPEGILRSLLVDGVIAGVGGVLVFLPQILFLFAFLLILEDSGYMARAAFLMDRLMGKVGLHGRAFIPLLSSYACAIPGIMATRTIENRRDRLTTILVAPLTTCSARLPVYALMVGAFIPNIPVLGPLRLQGLAMFALYFSGIFMALLMATFFRSTLLKGKKPPLLLELPTYKWPSHRNVLMGLYERSRLFVRRAGTVILTVSVVLWFLASYPKPPVDATEPAINYSYAGRIGHLIEPVVQPIGFNWKIGIALIPGFAAREVMVGALATVYAVEAADEDASAEALGEILKRDWSIATALSLLMWYVVAMQCLATLAVVRRETNSWRWPLFMLGYLTILAYGASFLTYRLALMAGLG